MDDEWCVDDMDKVLISWYVARPGLWFRIEPKYILINYFLRGREAENWRTCSF